MKPVVLTFVRHYLPGNRAGGPTRSIANLVERLGDEFEFRIVALDRDIGDTEAYPDIRPATWIRLGKAWVRYSAPNWFRLREVADVVRATPHSVLYLNGFFDPALTQPVLINRRLHRFGGAPVVLAPRGEFAGAALKIKRVKKRVYMRVARWTGLYSGLVWQASSEHEAQDIVREFDVGLPHKVAGQVSVAGNIVVAPDVVSSGAARAPVCQRDGRIRPGTPLRVCFLSRISPMKNLDFALRVLSEVRVPVDFFIYGPIEDHAYWDRCQQLIRALPAHVRASHRGAVEPHDVAATLGEHDLFLFPTRGENFGHVIFEALNAGLPVLIGDQTPWRDLATKGVGWELPLADQSAFARRVEEVAGWSHTDFERAALNAFAVSSQILNGDATVEANRALFIGAMNRGGRV